MVIGRQILIQQQNYISMWLALQLSHNDVLGVGLGWVLGLGGPESLPHGVRATLRQHLIHYLQHLNPAVFRDPWTVPPRPDGLPVHPHLKEYAGTAAISADT